MKKNSKKINYPSTRASKNERSFETRTFSGSIISRFLLTKKAQEEFLDLYTENSHAGRSVIEYKLTDKDKAVYDDFCKIKSISKTANKYNMTTHKLRTIIFNVAFALSNK